MGVSGAPSIQPKSEPLHVDGGLPLRLFVQPPRIAALFQLRDGVIGDGETFLFSQPNLQAAYDLSGAPPCEGNCVPEDFSLRHWRNRTKRELACKPLHLAQGAQKPQGGEGNWRLPSLALLKSRPGASSWMAADSHPWDGRQVSLNCVFLTLGSFSWRPKLRSVMTGDISMKKLALAVAAVLTL